MTIDELHKIFLGCSGLTTDSRQIHPGELFFALKGDNFDGNAFAIKALEDGAAYCVVNADSEAAKCSDSRILAFPDTLVTLRQLASYHRENTLHDGHRIKMLALTGTNGKTTTKELIRCVLSTKYKILCTEGNLNNNIGVPLTLLKLKAEHELAVIEMGASHPGDITELVDIAHPDFGLITNVGRAHLLGFGSFEGVKRTKGEMYDYIMSVDGKCFVNVGNADLCEMAKERPTLKRLEYSSSSLNTEILPMDGSVPFLKMKINGNLLETRLVGSYNADNILTAIAVGNQFGVPTIDAINAIAAYEPSNKRSQMVQSGKNTLVVDAYNANPSSMEAALENFSVIQNAEKVLCLGDMLELGDESTALHENVLKKAASLSPSMIILVGGEFKVAAERTGIKCLCFETSDKAAEYIKDHSISGCTILLKGSRGTKMEKLLEVL